MAFPTMAINYEAIPSCKRQIGNKYLKFNTKTRLKQTAEN